MIRNWTDDEQCLKYIDSLLYESGEYEKIDRELDPEDRSRWTDEE